MKPDDGLIAPAGYEIERWPDGSPKMINPNRVPYGTFYISVNGYATKVTSVGNEVQDKEHYGPYRIALRKLPERKLLNFREAVAAHGEGKNIRCEGEQHFWWHNSRSYPQSGGVAAVPIQWMIDRTDFYIQENPS